MLQMTIGSIWHSSAARVCSSCSPLTVALFLCRLQVVCCAQYFSSFQLHEFHNFSDYALHFFTGGRKVSGQSVYCDAMWIPSKYKKHTLMLWISCKYKKH